MNQAVPKTPVDNLAFRLHLCKRAQGNSSLQLGIMELCRRDILFWINTFVYQYNPRKIGKEVGAFITWDFQDDAVRQIVDSIETQVDLRIEKSREMGASWLCILVMLWYCLFHKHKKFLLISRDEDCVDRPEDPDALLWKMDFVLERLPHFMAGRVSRRKMGVLFQDTGSAVFGEASTKKAGVGGRATAAFLDEFSQQKDAEETFARTADTSHCRIFNFTHVGTDTMAYELCYSAKYADMRKLMMHWSQHPDKNPGLYRYNEQHHSVVTLDRIFDYSHTTFHMEGEPHGGPFPGLRSPWYDRECARRPARAVAMDLDIDPRGATDQFFDTLMIKSLKNELATEPFWVGRLEYDRDTARPLMLARDPKGPLKLWVHPKSKDELPLVKAAGGVDVSWGTGATPTCMSFGNARTGEKFAEYATARVDPAEAAIFAVAFCRLLREDVLLCWEIQGPGIIFGRKVVELGYRNIYYRYDEDVMGKVKDNKLRPGWTPNPKSIMALLTNYRDALRDRRCINRCWEALDECHNFVFTSSGVEHKNKGVKDKTGADASVHHGDRVVADAQMWKMIEELAVERLDDTVVEEWTLGSMEGREQFLQALSRREEW